MLTKLVLKKLSKLGNQYVDPMDDSRQEHLFHQMHSLINRSASQQEQKAIELAQEHESNGVDSNLDSARGNLYLDALDVFDRYNATPTIKSMCRDTKKCAKLRYYFFLGNRVGIIKEQKDAFSHGTHDFYLYLGGGYTQAGDDTRYMHMIKQGEVMQTPNPADLMNDSQAIMDSIKLGKQTLKNANKSIVKA